MSQAVSSSGGVKKSGAETEEEEEEVGVEEEEKVGVEEDGMADEALATLSLSSPSPSASSPSATARVSSGGLFALGRGIDTEGASSVALRGAGARKGRTTAAREELRRSMLALIAHSKEKTRRQKKLIGSGLANTPSTKREKKTSSNSRALPLSLFCFILSFLLAS